MASRNCTICNKPLTLGRFAYNQEECWDCFERQVESIARDTKTLKGEAIVDHMLDVMKEVHHIKREENMIKKFEDRTEMLFGAGDIGFNSGVYIENDELVGLLIFYNQEPRKIGEPGDIKAGTPVNLEDFPVIIKFSKSESIDVLIKALEEAKESMIK